MTVLIFQIQLSWVYTQASLEEIQSELKFFKCHFTNTFLIYSHS